jgi:hypothetical protein
LQELQEAVVEISTSNTPAKQNRDKDKDDTGDCPDSEQLAAEILAELKRKSVTVSHKITKENIMAETNIGKDTEGAAGRNNLFGAEEGFEEETAEETERNMGNSRADLTLLQTVKLADNTSEVDEILTDDVQLGSSTTGTNLTMNTSSIQGQHRFDLQIQKNSTDKAAQVTIQIIPHNISLQLGNSDHDPLLGLDLDNFAAIIQNSDSTVIQQRSQPTLAVVHKTVSNDKNNTHVTHINKDDTEIDRDLEPDANATLHEELNYTNGTFAYNQSEKSDVAHSSGILFARDNEEITRNYLSKISKPPHNPAITILVTNEKKNENLSITVFKENGSSDGARLPEANLPSNHSSYNKSHSGQISITNITHASLKNITESSSNNTDAVSEVQVTELSNHDGKGNLTTEEFWRVLQLAKEQLDKNGKNDTLTANNAISFTQNNSGSEDPEQAKHKLSALFSTDTIQNLVTAMNDTEDRNYDIQRQRYLSRLQELATELVSRSNGSFETTDYFNFTNTTHEIRDPTLDEGNNKYTDEKDP